MTAIPTLWKNYNCTATAVFAEGSSAAFFVSQFLFHKNYGLVPRIIVTCLRVVASRSWWFQG